MKKTQTNRQINECDSVKDGRNFYFAYVAAFFSMIGLTFFGIISFLRVGLPLPIEGMISFYVFLLAILFSPLLFGGNDPEINSTKRAYTALAIIVSPLLSFVVGQTLVLLYVVLAIVGVFKSYRILRAINWKQTGFLIIIAPVIAVYLYLELNFIVYASLFSYEYSLLGSPSGRWWMSVDSYYHMAIASMIQHYNSASLGMDGLVPLNYHYGSHVWFAALGLLTGLNPVFTYPFAYMIVVVPLIFYALLSFLGGLSQFRPGVEIKYISLLFGVQFLLDNIGKNSYYISESFLLSMVVVFFSLPIFLKAIQENNQKTANVWVKYIVLLFVSYLLFSLKISTGFLWVASISYLIIRLHWRSTPHFFYIALLALLSFFSFREFKLLTDHSEVGSGLTLQTIIHKIEPFSGFIENPAWLAMAMFLPVTYLLLRYLTRNTFNDEKITNKKVNFFSRCIRVELILVALIWSYFPVLYWEWAKHEENYTALSLLIPGFILLWILFKKTTFVRLERADCHVELIAVTFIVAFTPSILGAIDNRSELWFIYYIQWLAMPFFIVAIYSQKTIFMFNAWVKGRGYMVLIVILLVCIPILNAVKLAGSALYKGGEIYKIGSINNATAISLVALGKKNGSMVIPGEYKTIELEVTENVLSGEGFFTDIVKKKIRDGVVSRVARMLSVVDESEQYVVYVPPDNKLFWGTGHCMAIPWLIPAFLAKPMLLGLPPKRLGCDLPRGFGYPDYAKGSTSRFMSNLELCEHAKKRDFYSIFILKSLINTTENRFINCKT